MNEEELIVWCPVWGERHIKWFRDFTLKSLFWPGNLPSCGKKVTFLFCTVPGQTALIESILGPFHEVICREIARPMGDVKFALDCFIEGIREAKKRDCRLLLALPDFIFANGSINNLCAYAKGKPVCVTGLHLRADSFTLPPNLCDVPRSHQDLLRLCREHSHQTYRHSFNQHMPNGCHDGGVSITDLSPDRTDRLVAIHHLPSPMLCCFTERDYAWWMGADCFGAIDHRWPAALIREKRYRVMGSTNLFFMLELTDPDKNNIRLAEHGLCESYKENFYNHEVNECFVIDMGG